MHLCYAADLVPKLSCITTGSTPQNKDGEDAEAAENRPTTRQGESIQSPSSRILRSHGVLCSVIFNDDSVSWCLNCGQPLGHVCRQLCREHRDSLVDFCYNRDLKLAHQTESSMVERLIKYPERPSIARVTKIKSRYAVSS